MKLEINDRRKFEEFTSIEIKQHTQRRNYHKEIRKYLKMTEHF